MSKGQSRESGGTYSVKNGIATWNETTAVICFSSVSPDFRCLAHSFTLYMLLLSSSSSSSTHRSSSSLTSLFYSETLGALDRRSTLTMERAGFHGYHHHKLPRLNPSSSSSSSQGMNHSQGVSTDRPPMINGQKNMTANAGGGSSEQDPTDQCTVREQDRYMPIANVIRIMRRILPGHAKISDDAKETIQECVSEFIGFVTGEANDRCQQEQRKTITAEDVLFAMSKLGFDSYVDPLSLFLHRYRELEFGSDVRGVSSGQTLIAKRGADNGGGYDYGSGGFVAHPVYHSGGGYYGPPPMPPPPPPGFDSSYGPRNNG